MRIIFVLVFIFFTGCVNNKVDITKIQQTLLEENYYLDDIGNDLLGIEDLDTINKRIAKIELLLKNKDYQKIDNFLKLKKSFEVKMKLLQRIISYSSIFNNSLNFVQVHKESNFYKIINIKSINVDEEIEKISKLTTVNNNQKNLISHYTILLNYYKNYQYLCDEVNSLNTKDLIHKIRYKVVDYTMVYNLLIILFLLTIILSIFYKINKSRMKLFIIMLLSFLLLSFISYKVIKYNYQNKITTYEKQFLNDSLNNYNTIYEVNKMIAQLIFDSYINNDTVKTLFEHGKRKELYKYLNKDYIKLTKDYDLAVLQFHNKDDSSFLRMHHPSKYGDKLNNIRKSISFVNTTFKNYSGYEVGRFKGAFRNIFVLRNDNKYIGSVEISFSIGFFIKNYLANHKNHKINFLINGDNLLSSARNYFKPAPINGFFYDKSVLKLLNKNNILKTSRKKKKEKLNIISKKIKLGEPFTINFKNVKELVSIIPIKDKFTNKVVSTVHISKKDKYIDILHNEFYWIVFMVIFSILILIFFAYKQIVSKYDLEIEISKALEDNTKQLQVLQQQSKMAQMGEMIGAIAHQWRQPLNAVSTGIQNLKYDFKDGNLNNEEFIKDFIDKNKKTIKFMSKTIDDFRSFFRIDKERIDFKVKEATQSVIDMQSTQLKNHNITLNISGDEFIYNGLQSEYQQVILNLINNAKDVLIENEIDTPTIDIILENNKIYVQDNAGGIPNDIISRVFEPYFTTKDQGKGTGMGLYMSKMIIEDNMGGNLSVINKNNGALFCIKLKSL